MSAKKATTRSRKSGIDKQCPDNAKKTRGRPFPKGHTFGFKKGQSGNPAGRAKSAKYLSEAYREWLGAPSKKDPERTNADLLAEVIGSQALEGDIAAAREICDRTEGKPRQAVDITVEGRKREVVHRAIESLMAEAGIERDEAITQLTAITPEAREWIN